MSTNGHPGEHSAQDATAPVSPAAPAAMLPWSPGRGTTGYAHLRKSNPSNEVALPTRKWLDKLPQPVRPINLIGQYPRIVNRVAEAWGNPAAFGELSTDLLYDFRGNRAGFPPEIVRELRGLRDHYYQSARTK